MSKIKLILNVVQDLRSLTDSLEALAHAIEEPEEHEGDVVRVEQIALAPEQSNEPVQAAAAQEQTADNRKPATQIPGAPVAESLAPDAPTPPTLVELRAFVAARSTPQTRPKIRALLAGHGVAKADRFAGKCISRPDAGGGSTVSEMAQATGNIDHAARTHAVLSSSSSHRWLMCPPSVKLSEQFADKPSVYAEEGTFLHELSEMKLHRYLGDIPPETLVAQYVEHRDNDFYSDEAENVTDEYVDFCIETIEAVRASCPDPLILVEYRLDFSEYVPEGFGTGDLVIVADGVLEIVDFKSGRGVRVEADHNSQLMLYGLGALLGV